MDEACPNCWERMQKLAEMGSFEVHWCEQCGTVHIKNTASQGGETHIPEAAEMYEKEY
jgi:hypothetical protein